MKLFFLTALSLAFLAGCSQQPDNKSGPEQKQSLEAADQLRKSGKPVQAANILRAMQAQHADDPAVLSRLGYALIDAGQPESAVTVFDKLILLKPDDALAYDGKAVAFDYAGNHLAAQDLYQRALTLSPGNPGIKNNLALSLILNNRADEAIKLLEPLADQPDANPKVRQNLALAYGMKGKRAQALKLNQEALSPQEAQENMHFYEQYARALKKNSSSHNPPPDQIGFIETPPAEKAKPIAAAGKTHAEALSAAPVASPPVEAAPAQPADAMFGGQLEFNYPEQVKH